MNTTQTHLLSIDAGTQSLRALVFDLQGNLLARSQVIYPAVECPGAYWAEQDATSFWQALISACNELWQNPAVDRRNLAGLSLTSQRGTLINVDQNGTPLRPAILWMDQRRTTQQYALPFWWSLLFRAVGVHKTIKDLQASAESLWIKENQPEIWQNTHKWLVVSAFLNYKLTGVFKDSCASQVAYLPFDYKKQTWAHRNDWKWSVLGIQRSQLPELVPPGVLIGHVTAQAHSETGLPEGLPIIAGAADKACEVLGSGCLTSDLGHLSLGTAATFNLPSQSYLEAYPFIPPYPAAVANNYNVEIQLFKGFWMVSWFLEQFGQPELERAKAHQHQTGTPIQAETFLEDLLNRTPVGCDGLVLQPFWSPGIKLPGSEAKGAIIGFDQRHGRSHLYRAIIEGLAHGLQAARLHLQKRGNTVLKEIRCSGGGSQSDAVMQIFADVFGLPAIRPHTFETSGLGAAMIAAVGLGLVENTATAVAKMTRPGDCFQPRAIHHQTYSNLHKGVYQRMYRRLKPLYKHLLNQHQLVR